jgi:hypothetical protein
MQEREREGEGEEGEDELHIFVMATGHNYSCTKSIIFSGRQSF